MTRGLITPFGTGEFFCQTGRVEYVHGHGIDQPLRFYREEYSDSIPGASFIPQANWRGVYDMGVRDGLCYMRSWTSQPAEPPGERQIGGVDTTSYSVPTSGTETLCADVDWPAQYTWAYHQYRKGYHGPYSWMGSLAFGMRDASGLHYRRNRFYDAEQGRFTQEDPIGLAGGINLYGYANGDPVSYSDPYGLNPCLVHPKLCDIAAGAAIGAVMGAATQAAINVAQDRPITEGVGRAALEGGAIGGALGGVATVARSLRGANVLDDAGRAGAAARTLLREGDAVLGVVHEGKLIAHTSNVTLGHAQFIERTLGSLPAGAEAVTIGKLEGTITVIRSRVIHGRAMPASKEAFDAAKAVFQ